MHLELELHPPTSATLTHPPSLRSATPLRAAACLVFSCLGQEFSESRADYGPRSILPSVRQTTIWLLIALILYYHACIWSMISLCGEGRILNRLNREVYVGVAVAGQDGRIAVISGESAERG